MEVVRDCETRKDFDQLLENSHKQPVFLFKHSTRCPISRAAWSAYQQFGHGGPDAELWRVLVVENAGLSREIAREIEVRHESPQAILFHNGQVLWHESHWAIKEDALLRALDSALAS